jgi:uncharacterized protein (TIGR03437 family)
MRGPLISILALMALASPVGARPSATAAVALTSTLNPSVYGMPFTVKVTATGAPGYPVPTGSVALIDGSSTHSPLATVELDATGSAQLSFPMQLGTAASAPGSYIPYVLSAGVHAISAIYTGDTVYPSTYASPILQQVQRAATTTAVATSQTPQGATTIFAVVSPIGTSLPCPTVTGNNLTDGSPSGTVEIFNGGQSMGSIAVVQSIATGCSSIATTYVPQVTGSLTATYSGDSNFGASASTTSQGSSGLFPTNVNLDATPNNPTITQPITFTATIDTIDSNIPPNGVVQFFLDGATLLGTVSVVNSTASVTATLTGGSHTLTANYSGDTNYQLSSATIGESVSKLSDSLVVTASAPLAAYGQAVTFTAQVKTQTVTGVASPTGTVQFFGGCLCGIYGGFVIQSTIGAAPLSGGVATFTVASLPPGALQVVATYGGDSNWVTVTSPPVALSISKASTTTAWTSLGTDPQSGNLVATATVQAPAFGTPTGTVQVLDAATNAVLATVPLSAAGSATAIFSAKTAAILAAYSGDANFAASTSAPATLLTVADAAGYGTSSVAPDEIASIFGSGLAAPVQITDSSGATLTPSLLLASPSQINMIIPTATALGVATVTVKPPSGPTFSKSITITRVAPGLFAANGGGTGPAAAQIIRVHAADQSQTVESVVAQDATGKQWVATPIVFGSDSLYLVLYGTGIRNRSANANVMCSIGSKVLPVLFSGAQGGFAGLDQVNVALPNTLQGAGTVSVVVSADGQSSNAVTLVFQ